MTKVGVMDGPGMERMPDSRAKSSEEWYMDETRMRRAEPRREIQVREGKKASHWQAATMNAEGERVGVLALKAH